MVVSQEWSVFSPATRHELPQLMRRAPTTARIPCYSELHLVHRNHNIAMVLLASQASCKLHHIRREGYIGSLIELSYSLR